MAQTTTSVTPATTTPDSLSLNFELPHGRDLAYVYQHSWLNTRMRPQKPHYFSHYFGAKIGQCRTVAPSWLV